MTEALVPTTKVDFEELGFQTMLHSGDENHAKKICAFHLGAYADWLQPDIANLNSKIRNGTHQRCALHSNLYDRPIPVDDAAMLARSVKVNAVKANVQPGRSSSLWSKPQTGVSVGEPTSAE